MAVKVVKNWHRNIASKLTGESITVSTTYYSFNKEEIDKIEEMLPDGFIVKELPDKLNNPLIKAAYIHCRATRDDPMSPICIQCALRKECQGC